MGMGKVGGGAKTGTSVRKEFNAVSPVFAPLYRYSPGSFLAQKMIFFPSGDQAGLP